MKNISGFSKEDKLVVEYMKKSIIILTQDYIFLANQPDYVTLYILKRRDKIGRTCASYSEVLIDLIGKKAYYEWCATDFQKEIKK